MVIENSICSDLNIIKALVYDKYDLALSNQKPSFESAAYGACSFQLNGFKIEHRTSKITPKKAGQFVTIWKRNQNGITEPFDLSDDIDFVMITSKSVNNIGQFIFPKSVLVNHNIFSKNAKGGKRGIRVYPPWDVATNKQAEKTQSWQTKYFITPANFELLGKFFNEVNNK